MLGIAKAMSSSKCRKAPGAFDALYTVCEALKTVTGDHHRDSVRDACPRSRSTVWAMATSSSPSGQLHQPERHPVAVIGYQGRQDTVLLDLTYPVYKAE